MNDLGGFVKALVIPPHTVTRTNTRGKVRRRRMVWLMVQHIGILGYILTSISSLCQYRVGLERLASGARKVDDRRDGDKEWTRVNQQVYKVEGKGVSQYSEPLLFESSLWVQEEATDIYAQNPSTLSLDLQHHNGGQAGPAF
jgi:hypothetical protein